MSDAVDISREAVEHLASELTAGCAALDEHGEQHLDPLTAPVAVDPMVLLHASAMIRALRTALDAAEEAVEAARTALAALVPDPAHAPSHVWPSQLSASDRACLATAYATLTAALAQPDAMTDACAISHPVLDRRCCACANGHARFEPTTVRIFCAFYGERGWDDTCDKHQPKATRERRGGR